MCEYLVWNNSAFDWFLAEVEDWMTIMARGAKLCREHLLQTPIQFLKASFK